MGSLKTHSIRRLFCGAAAAVLLSASGAACAQEQRTFEIPAQPLVSALYQFGEQSGRQVLFKPSLADNKTSAGVSSTADQTQVLAQLLEGTGLSFRRSGDVYLIEESGVPQSGSAAGDGADGTVEALIVTAQKREEDIQDVPIAISAFTPKDLEQQKIEGGFDLVKAIPNVTFSKNNFSSYNFSIRGVGTKAISATTDPGVAVAFNNTALIQNRLFEQEYFDVERVEVLRGPQGTLYGRNATSGVINVISAKPDLNDFDGWLKGEVGNYDTKRVSAMVNIPLAEDKLAIRFAGALTSREGYDFNEKTHNAINGRDLWSARVTVGFNPTENIRGNLIWERFEEDDDRSRTGKQLCHRDDGKAVIGNTSTADTISIDGMYTLLRQAMFGQGCKPGNLYEDAAFGTPNGLSYSFVFGAIANPYGSLGADANGNLQTIIQKTDPYGGMMQSRDLRVISSIRDPRYRANADLVELNIDVDLSPSLRFSSQTAYDKDEVYSFQDYNRFNSLPIFTDTASLQSVGNGGWASLAPGGQFCDPQIGCSNTVAGFDISQAKARQFSQEFRLQSDFEGPFNFSVGANYTNFNALVDYYVMFNLITAIASIPPFNDDVDPDMCAGLGLPFGVDETLPSSDPRGACVYIDPNPVQRINGEGHNYFRSKNPYKLKSWAGFGEGYWQVSDSVKLTAGLRYTDDKKAFIPVPSQVLLAPGLLGGGYVGAGYPERPAIKQHWDEWTGRMGLDWKADLPFTDDTLLYAFYSRGYKGGGANPPSPGFATLQDYLDYGTATQEQIDFFLGFGMKFPLLQLTAVEYGPTFDPEFVNAYEVGAKNTLFGGAMTLNFTGFFYDYDGYQVSQIRDRTAVNENFDAKVWGAEVEAMFAPNEHLRIVANLGYLDTQIGDGETSIDIMNRTGGDPYYQVVKPWFQLPSNCVAPTHVAEEWVKGNAGNLAGYQVLCGGLGGILGGFYPLPDSERGGAQYDVFNYPELNGGAGIKSRLGGNELPNAPHWTANVGAQYGWDVLEGWTATVRGDAYWQAQSWARVYNLDPYDKLHGWYNVNLSLWIERPDDDLKIELYAKNLLDKTPITDAFLNSDDTGLTTNVFVLDPRLVGLSIRKGF